MKPAYDLLAVVLQLQGEPGARPVLPLGHQAQALILNLVRRVDARLAEALHANAPVKPLTVTVLPTRARADVIELRLSFGGAALFFPLMTALTAAPPRLQVGKNVMTLLGAVHAPERHPWAGYTSFAALAAAAHPSQTATLAFATPTAFGQGERSNGRPRLGLLPTPEAVFGSLARRWNEWAPAELQLPPAQVEAAISETVVSRYRLASEMLMLGKAPQKGFVGQVSYELPADVALARLLSLLADAAFYLGVGMKTARGMGLCRRLAED
ncbi:CRISPR system precrRNA processing endoribonuclease RAMP protein Cas6 [Kallotenue papyrolyticum]|uniref:CRISPR system precrRNA processing endoribonuclease RAMP protein Cas6 n=1 Tax=Kallotenue papyrolyticum TaxID=1325125 RepID=UPI0004928999|nr:CRISPR system precrRNA processing endoribonuclease RAMP protein Cas6 [Kallotenue papyrolyticum]